MTNADTPVRRVGICHLCRHLSVATTTGNWTCAAFPAGILDEVIAGLIDHHQSIDGDGGIVFEPRDEGDER